MDETPLHIFDTWFEHYCKQPWGFELENYRHAELCFITYNGLIPSKSPRPFEEFLFKPQVVSDENEENSDEDMDWRQMKSILQARSVTKDGE